MDTKQSTNSISPTLQAQVIGEDGGIAIYRLRVTKSTDSGTISLTSYEVNWPDDKPIGWQGRRHLIKRTTRKPVILEE